MTDRNSYKKWTSEDDELLRNLVLANVSPFDIAAELGRSVSTVKARAHCLGITLRRLGDADLEKGEMITACETGEARKD
jgi:hypothetical protein